MLLVKYKLDLMGEQDARWDKDDTEPADNYTLLYEDGNAVRLFGTGFFVRKGIISAVKWVEFVSHRMPHYNTKRPLV
jgi:hypothetical protein